MLEEARLFLARRLAVEIDEVVDAHTEQSREHPCVEIGACRRIIAAPLIAPAIVALIFRADQSCDVSRMPAKREHHAHNAQRAAGTDEQIVGLFEDQASAGWKRVERRAIVGFWPQRAGVMVLRVELRMKLCQS